MNVDSLHIFVKVAKLGSFTQAARQMHTDPSSISRNIAGLEKKLGIRLFQRNTRHITLTEAGSAYLYRVEAILDELERAHDEALSMSTQPCGTLRLSTSIAFGQTRLIPLLPAFRQQYPEVGVDLILTNDVQDLVADKIDLAIRSAPVFDQAIVRTRLFDTHYHICASKEYLQQWPTIEKPQDLLQHEMLVFSHPDFQGPLIFKDPTGDVVEVQTNSHLKVSNPMALRQCVLEGMGPALLDNWLVKDQLANGECIDLFPDYQVTTTEFNKSIWLLYPSRRFLPYKVRAMVDFLKQYLGDFC